MIGKTVGELSPFKDIESNQIMLERLQENGYVRYEDLPLETCDGRHLAVEFVSNVYQAGEQNVINAMSVRTSRSGRRGKRTFAALLAAIIESADDAMVSKTAKASSLAGTTAPNGCMATRLKK